MKLTKMCAALALAIAPLFAYALEDRSIENASGRTVFVARFFDTGDGSFDDDNTSFWSWQGYQAYKDQVVDGLSYWAEILQPQGNNPATIVNIGTVNMPGNAYGGSPGANGGQSALTQMQQNIFGLLPATGTLPLGGHGFFGLGQDDYALNPAFTQTPLTGKDSVFLTAIHEVAHGLGVGSSVEDKGAIDVFEPYFESRLNRWSQLLIDDNGNPARAGQKILCNGCNNAYDPDAFDMRQDKAVLIGTHINQVLAGGLRGVPVKILDDAGNVDPNYMSHIELRNSVMSHQDYRNYTGFMEAELAVLQDLGFTIDRANFFGRSVYGDGLELVNTQGFFERNAAGTQYRPGRYNQATLGLGLHIYGSNNHIRQAADLLSAGSGGAGIRVDGENNTVIVDPGVKIHANGLNGQGIQFAYGRRHTLVHRGDIQATGSQGVGLRFDFGTNALGSAVENRGSYIHSVDGVDRPLLPELDGPLVEQADITGRVAGRQAAILISDNAYVKRINLMQGARIEGDIISHYAQRDGNNELRLTTLSFGQAADSLGRATGQPDAAFRLSYAGNITGQDNLALSFDGGETRLDGTLQVYSAKVQETATLGGNARFDLATGSALINAGTLAPGNSIGRISVSGDYRQTATGRLVAEFDGNGAHDVLAVSGNVDLTGTLELAPLADWYQNTWSVDTSTLVEAASRSGSFSATQITRLSPILQFSAVSLGDERYRLSATRAQDAYSQYGRDDNQRAAGRALFNLASAGPADAQTLFREIDFSASDGSQIPDALAQLSPANYSALMAASLMRERTIMQTAHQGLSQSTQRPGTDWQGYATAFGSEADQDAGESMIGYDAKLYGLVVGTGRRLASASDFAVGAQLDISTLSVRPDAPYLGKSKATAGGITAHLQYRPDSTQGLFAFSGLRLGLDQVDMRRQISIGNYQTTHSSDWTGRSLSLDAGTGYLWRLNPALSAGPFVSMNYALLSRPSIDESGNAATRLHLDSMRIDALRSSLGLATSWRSARSDGSTLAMHFDIRWDREWLNRDLTQAAHFVIAPTNTTFNTINNVLPRNTMGMRAGLTWQRSEGLSVGATLSAQLGSGYSSLQGQANFSWTF
ncbi:autotransporter domain-containing protein [Pusillimonas sp. NJUB218]|uniref:autotransporter outer membrane beta-barrel domain-containing protein n=1 Tax=Pusillimonas sp. NJUB218 TaxID=2023230 RepID=UPI000F4B55E5|nr:autotransporter outer membrane beta-barrel domain-containing protein [Pusillimonas sp. NJUB218]ROT45951.1 autotransporter [Pusillimonas sp. NJUB218]